MATAIIKIDDEQYGCDVIHPYISAPVLVPGPPGSESWAPKPDNGKALVQPSAGPLPLCGRGRTFEVWIGNERFELTVSSITGGVHDQQVWGFLREVA
jgi:hypothetical protein